MGKNYDKINEKYSDKNLMAGNVSFEDEPIEVQRDYEQWKRNRVISNAKTIKDQFQKDPELLRQVVNSLGGQRADARADAEYDKLVREEAEARLQAHKEDGRSLLDGSTD